MTNTPHTQPSPGPAPEPGMPVGGTGPAEEGPGSLEPGRGKRAWAWVRAGSWVKWIRRAALVALVVWGGWELLVDGVPRVCPQELHEGVPVKVCEPMGLTDPRVALFLLTAGLLLLPDLSELEVAGVLRLHRKVDEARQEVAELTGELASVRNQVSTWTSAGAVAQATGIHSDRTYVFPRAAATGAALEDISSGDSSVLEAGEEKGMFMMLAFDAGMAGLIRLLPNQGAGASVVGMALDEDGAPAYHSAVLTTSAGASVVGTLVTQARQSPHDTQVVKDGQMWLATAPAHVGGGQVGAVGVAVPEPEDEAAAPGWDAEGWGAQVAEKVDLVAGAYAAMLVTLLEEPVPGLGTGADEGQV